MYRIGAGPGELNVHFYEDKSIEACDAERVSVGYEGDRFGLLICTRHRLHGAQTHTRTYQSDPHGCGWTANPSVHISESSTLYPADIRRVSQVVFDGLYVVMFLL